MCVRKIVTMLYSVVGIPLMALYLALFGRGLCVCVSDCE